MPIEMFWWVEPLWRTGMLMLPISAAIIACLSKWVHRKKAVTIAAYVLAILGFLPIVACVCIVVGWLLVNAFVLIWR